MTQVTVITGASSGIGAALAQRFASAGDVVVLLARRLDKLDEIVSGIRASGGLAHGLQLDVTNRERVLGLFEDIHREIGPVDRLIVNAGVAGSSKAVDFNSEALARIIDVNLIAAAHCIQAVLPTMLQRRRGHLVAVGSLAGYRGLPGSGAYCASKAGLAALMESIRLEVRSYGLDVTLICPGYIRTPLTNTNRFKMPHLLEVDDAAERIFRSVARRDSEYSFPWQLAWKVRFARLLPNWVYQAFMGVKRAKKKLT